MLTSGFGFTDAFYKNYSAEVQDAPYPVRIECTSLRRVQGADPNGCNGEIDRFVDAVLVAAIPQIGNTNHVVTVDRSENQFANVPRLNFNIMAMYSFTPFDNATLSANVRYYYQTAIYFNVDNSPNLYQPGYGLVDAAVALMIDSTNTRIELWGKNLTNNEYLQGGFSFGPALGADGVYVGRPLSFGMTLTPLF